MPRAKILAAIFALAVRDPPAQVRLAAGKDSAPGDDGEAGERFDRRAGASLRCRLLAEISISTMACSRRSRRGCRGSMSGWRANPPRARHRAGDGGDAARRDRCVRGRSSRCKLADEAVSTSCQPESPRADRGASRALHHRLRLAGACRLPGAAEAKRCRAAALSAHRYVLRASGVFAEAVAFGLVTVVPDRDSMAVRSLAGLACRHGVSSIGRVADHRCGSCRGAATIIRCWRRARKARGRMAAAALRRGDAQYILARLAK